MKARALARREASKRSKDAYDIVYCLRHIEGGLDRLARDFESRLHHPAIASGKEELARLFATREALGPRPMPTM